MNTPSVCEWHPELTPGGRVSTMFFRTACGQRHAPIFSQHEWKFCPYCASRLSILKDVPALARIPSDTNEEGDFDDDDDDIIPF